MRWIFGMLLWASVAQADPVDQIMAAAQDAFARMPDVQTVDQINGECGATRRVDPRVAYCTTTNTILVARDVRDQRMTQYLLAHAYGHAVQVRHGVADDALAAIRSRPADEVMLRGLVERQVDCIAGFLVQRAGLPTIKLSEVFDADPLTAPHWGRNPLRIGPVVAVDLAARAQWFALGQSGDLAACAPGEFSSEKLVLALQR